tara:strand:+ start:7439 stop:8095 length:657 start_codon:yes stop_codon:yes gene_type:complete
MGREINLLRNYPKSKRNLDERKINKKKFQSIARKFDRRFFDESRDTGYGGFYYNKRFWSKVVKDFKKYYKLKNNMSVLDVGCGKGFTLVDLKKLMPKIKIRGIDISKYAIKNSHKKVKKYLDVGCCSKLPYKDNSFDLVLAINTIHNLNKKKCAKAIKEINRVSRKSSFIMVDAYKNEIEKKRMYNWNLTAKTIMSRKSWKNFFKKNNFKGDYFWFTP